ncbi:MAG TPA: VOC family protein [Pyrinomonadaceae bacterium]|jgi:uncharacterized glyoxalase superfamily protein PhnB|nr:VOC family protein [Pyrinomonadaceae bacterium]
MMHVLDVRATVDWYQDIGFTVNETYGNDSGGLSFAILSFGSTQVMFNQGGQPSTARRREVDLYVYADDVDAILNRINDHVEVVEGLRDTFYGMREFTIRDINRFWITFGQESAFGMLMRGIHEKDTELIQSALTDGSISAESLTTALTSVSTGSTQNREIADLLRAAGAVMPPQIDDELLRSHAGHYKSEKGIDVQIVAKAGQLFAVLAGEEAIDLIPVDDLTFRPSRFKGITVRFNSEAGKTIGFTLTEGATKTEHSRVDV